MLHKLKKIGLNQNFKKDSPYRKACYVSESGRGQETGKRAMRESTEALRQGAERVIGHSGTKVEREY